MHVDDFKWNVPSDENNKKNLNAKQLKLNKIFKKKKKNYKLFRAAARLVKATHKNSNKYRNWNAKYKRERCVYRMRVNIMWWWSYVSLLCAFKIQIKSCKIDVDLCKCNWGQWLIKAFRTSSQSVEVDQCTDTEVQTRMGLLVYLYTIFMSRLTTHMNHMIRALKMKAKSHI